MKIFISWSKESGNVVAVALKEFIQEVFGERQNLQVFVSSQDIYAGERWFDKIADEISKARVAIICLTKENENSKWLNFESGAIAFNKENAIICPFLADIDKLENENPLNNYQITLNKMDHIIKLVEAINREGKFRLEKNQLTTLVKKPFASLQKKIKALKFASPVNGERTTVYPLHVQSKVEKNKVFLGTPMASITVEEYLENRNEILAIIQTIKTFCGVEHLYSPIITNTDPANFEGQEKSMETDFTELKTSEYYVFIYPAKVASSILVEIGYAIALMKKTIIFVKHRKDLPFMLEKADFENRKIKIYEYESLAQLKKQIQNEGKFIFKFRE